MTHCINRSIIVQRLRDVRGLIAMFLMSISDVSDNCTVLRLFKPTPMYPLRQKSFPSLKTVAKLCVNLRKTKELVFFRRPHVISNTSDITVTLNVLEGCVCQLNLRHDC